MVQDVGSDELCGPYEGTDSWQDQARLKMQQIDNDAEIYFKNMWCSETCPCDAANTSFFDDLSETELEKIGRTNDPSKTQYYVPLYYVDTTDPANDEPYSDTMYQCYEDF